MKLPGRAAVAMTPFCQADANPDTTGFRFFAQGCSRGAACRTRPGHVHDTSETCRRLLEGPLAGAAVPHLGAPRAAGMRPQRRGGDGRNVSHRWIGALCRRSAQVPAARVRRPVPRLLRLALQGPELALQPRPGAAERRPRDGRDRPRVAEALIRSSPWQDLPNYAQHVVPIHSLPEEWLWCGARRRGAPKAVSSVSSHRPECAGARRGAATPPSRAQRPSTSATTRSPRSPSSARRRA